MAKTYDLRDKEGVLKATFPEHVMQKIAFQAVGGWRPYQAGADAPVTRCFEVSEDGIYTIANSDARHRVQIYIWAGDKLVEIEK